MPAKKNSKQSRKESLKRSRAARKGWQTRARNKRSLAAKKGWRTRRKKQRKPQPKKPALRNREWLISIDYNDTRGFRADLWMVAERDATATMLADQARKQLPTGKQFIANWFEGGFSEITQGELTDMRKQTRIRSFRRYKR